MLKVPLSHPDIIYHLGAAGHGSKVLIVDGNYPISTKLKPGTPIVNLNFSPGTLKVGSVLEVLCQVIAIEAAEVMRPEDAHKPPVYSEFERILSRPLTLCSLGRDAFYTECSKNKNLVLVIVTSDTQPYANILLTVGVVS